MNHKNFSKGIIALIVPGVINVAVATDYSSISTEELMDMRSQARDMTREDREIFRSEMQGRVASMSDDERASFQQMRGQGSGGGKQNRYSKR